MAEPMGLHLTGKQVKECEKDSSQMEPSLQLNQERANNHKYN